MPLRGSVSDRIHELSYYGSKPRSHRQIVAIALNSARKDRAKRRGRVSRRR
jgi:cation transport regulator ChaB